MNLADDVLTKQNGCLLGFLSLMCFTVLNPLKKNSPYTDDKKCSLTFFSTICKLYFIDFFTPTEIYFYLKYEKHIVIVTLFKRDLFTYLRSEVAEREID